MDFTNLVQQKLSGKDSCVFSIFGQVVNDQGKSTYVLALVQSQEECGLFVYSCAQVSANNPDELLLERTFPVNSDFKFNIIAATSQVVGHNTSESVLPVRFQNLTDSLLIELPQGDTFGLFIKELKRVIQVHSQNSGFGLPSTFSWIEKYSRPHFSSGNPFSTMETSNTTNLGSENTTADWQHALLSQPQADCPVIYDTVEANKSSLPREQDFADSWTGYDNGVTTTATDTGALQVSIKRSYDKSLDDLSDRDMPQTPMGGRENIIKYVMKAKSEEYTDIKKCRIFCGTWNTNGQAASQPIADWLSPSEDTEAPDIYAVGFQELDLSKSAFIVAESLREEEWYNRVKAALHRKGKYRKVKLIRLVGMMLVVFVRVELQEHISKVMWESVGTGILGMMGNKGGVGVRFEMNDTSICFVNSHLAAHTEEYERRNQDFKDINSRMIFASRNGISDHELVFWIGDLNYRLSDIDNDTCKKLINSKDLKSLMRHDQLCRQIAMKRVFLDYTEGAVKFVPTYKYDPGTDNWDTSEKCRAPAWCDRILYRGPGIRQLAYRSHQNCRISDHKPVSAIFDVDIKVINGTKYRRVYEDVMKNLDRLENECLPQVSLDITDIHFENIKFIEPQSRIVTITNTGQGPLEFLFINKPGDNLHCKPWLTVEPSRGVINKNGKCEVQLEVYVNKSTAPKFNCGEDKLEDILVLHLEGGKDLFVTLSGAYQPSCFGSSIGALVHMFGPIREVETATLINLEQTGSSPTGKKPLDIPKEIYRLVDHLNRYGLNEDDLFQQPGQHSEIQLIRDCLDTGNPSEIPGSVHSTAEALLMFLESLAEPVIPHAYYTKCLECCSNFTLCKQVLAKLPKCHRNVFKYLCAFLRKILQLSSKNNLDAKFLATLFSGLMLRGPGSETAEKSSVTERREEGRKRSCFVYHFLVNDYDE